jgi:hypothetical protein
VVLENVSSTAVEIEYDRHPLQYLDMVVTGPGGAVVSAGHYGDIFSPLGRTSALRLEPGQQFTHNVSLLGRTPQAEERPGTYVARAIYQYKGLRVVSEPLAFVLPDQPAGEDGAR